VCFCCSDETDPKPVTRGVQGFKGKRKLFEAPKPHHYYHLEYKLFPNDPDPVKADVVTYGVAAKIYTESDSKVLKTWRDGDRTWVTWTHRLVKWDIICGKKKSTHPKDGHTFFNPLALPPVFLEALDPPPSGFLGLKVQD